MSSNTRECQHKDIALPACSVVNICRSAIDRHNTSLKISFEVSTVVASGVAAFNSRRAARTPRNNCNGLGSPTGLQSTVRNIDLVRPGRRSMA